MLLKNTSLYFVGELINRAGKLAAMYLLARVISKAEFGNYSYLLSICLIVLVFLDFGMNTLVILRTSWKRFEHLLPFFFAGKLITITGVCATLALYDLRYGLFGTTGTLTPFLLLCVGWDATAFLGNTLRTRLDFIGEFWIKVIANLSFLFLVLIALVASFKLSVVSALWLQATGFLFACIFGLLRARRGVARKFPPIRHARRGLLAIGRIGAPMSLAASIGTLQTSIDSLVLGASSNMEINASFSLVNRLGLLTQMPVNAIIFSGLPYVTESLRGGKVPPRQWLHFLVEGLALAAIIMGHMLVLGSEWGIPAVLGAKYSDVSRIAPWLGFYLIPIYIYPLYSALLSATRSVLASQLISGIGTVLNAVLDLFSIRLFGPYAVAWVAGSTHWVLLLIFVLYTRKRIGYWPISARAAGIAVFGGGTILLPYLLFPTLSLPEIALRTAAVLAASGCLMLLLRHNRAQLGRPIGY